MCYKQRQKCAGQSEEYRITLTFPFMSTFRGAVKVMAWRVHVLSVSAGLGCSVMRGSFSIFTNKKHNTGLLQGLYLVGFRAKGFFVSYCMDPEG